MRSWWIIAACSIGMSGLAQSAQPGSGAADFKVLFNIDLKRTYVDHQHVRLFGFRLGAWKGNDIVAIGYFGLSDPVLRRDQFVQDIGNTDVALDISYGALFYERVMLDTRKWQISVPIDVGLGNVRQSVPDTANVFRTYSEREVLIGEYGAKVSYKLFYWLHLNAGGGYRHTFTRNRLADRTYSGLTWSIGLGLKVGEIYRRIKNGDSDEGHE